MPDKSKLHNQLEALPLVNAQATLGEGALWNWQEQQLYWVDIIGCTLHIYDPHTHTDKQWNLSSKAGTVVPVQGGNALVALQTGIHHLETTTGLLTLVNNPITSPDIRFNDGKCDPSGRFWVGTLAMNGTRGAAFLYRLDADGTLHQMLDGISISNGIVWTSDKRTMYFNDTPTQSVQAFDYDDATGNISNRRVVIRMPEGDGSPDGMTIDAEDKLWVAMWGAGSVNRYDPISGNLLQKVNVPSPLTSSCALGGADLKTLYITTARVDMSPEQLEQYPLSGNIFQVTVEIPGVPASLYQPESPDFAQRKDASL